MRKVLNELTLVLHKKAGFLVPRTIRQKVYWMLNPPDSRKRIDLIFDIVGTCNLRCPSCPVGNMPATNPAGKMDTELYRKILLKAKKEYVIQNLVLYNWGESLLHPQLPEFVSIAKEMGIYVSLSSNLNILRREEELFRAKPDYLRVSVSGFTQSVYGVTHKGGNIEQVKENMKSLSATKKKLGNTETNINVYFHKYKHNLHEVAPMKAFAESLGFNFSETWAYYMPYENVADYAEGRLSQSESQFVETQFALPIKKAVQAAQAYKNEPCSLYENQVILDLQGNLLTCCAVYNFDKNRLGSFLEMTPETLEAKKATNTSCERCMSHGLHKYFLWEGHPQLGPTFESLVKETLEEGKSPESISAPCPSPQQLRKDVGASRY